MGSEQAAVHKLGLGQGLDLFVNCLGVDSTPTVWSFLTTFHWQTFIISDRSYEHRVWAVVAPAGVVDG